MIAQSSYTLLTLIPDRPVQSNINSASLMARALLLDVFRHSPTFIRSCLPDIADYDHITRVPGEPDVPNVYDVISA